MEMACHGRNEDDTEYSVAERKPRLWAQLGSSGHCDVGRSCLGRRHHGCTVVGSARQVTMRARKGTSEEALWDGEAQSRLMPSVK